jgi:hypothetical protein
LRQRHIHGSIRNGRIGIRRQHRQQLSAVFRRERRATRANRQLLFRANVTGTDGFA